MDAANHLRCAATSSLLRPIDERESVEREANNRRKDRDRQAFRRTPVILFGHMVQMKEDDGDHISERTIARGARRFEG